MRENQLGATEILGSRNSKAPEERLPTAGNISTSNYRQSQLPVFGDSSNNRLAILEIGRKLEPDGSDVLPPTSSSSIRPRKKEVDETRKGAGRGHEVPKVSEGGCRCKSWSDVFQSPPLPPDGEGQNQSPHAFSSKQSASTTRSMNTKPTKGLRALVTERLFRQSKPTSFSPWETEWADFREKHGQEMKEMKQMYAALQAMCHDLKSMASQRDNASVSTSRRSSVSESCESNRVDRSPLLGHSNKDGMVDRRPDSCEKHQSTRRASSVPRSRVNWDTGLIKENSMQVRVPHNISGCCPTTVLFEEIVQVEKAFLRNFCATLVKYGEARFLPGDVDSNQNDNAMAVLVGRLLPHATFAKPWHFKYGIEAWLNRVVFHEFGSASYGLQKESGRFHDPLPHRISSWDEYQRLAVLSPIEAIDSEGKVYHRNFHVFCNKKFQIIHDKLQWWHEWPDTLVEDFLEAMKHIWCAHKLAFAFEPPAAMFGVKTSTAFDEKFMEALDAFAAPQFESLPSASRVGFMVTPGFIVQDRIIKSQVYLMPKLGASQPPL